MSPSFLVPNHDNDFQNDNNDELVSGLAIGLCSYMNLPLENIPSSSWNFLITPENQTREQKRLKRTLSFADSIASDTSIGGGSAGGNTTATLSRSGSTNSLTGSPKLPVRDLIRTCSRLYLEAEVVDEADAVIINADEGRNDAGGDAMRLVQLLICCAEAVACRDKVYATALLSELRFTTLEFGSSFQRVASCFVQGLADRLAAVQPPGAVGFGAPPLSLANKENYYHMEKTKEEALQLAYEICPYIRFGHFVANSSILEAFEGESSVHVVDLGMTLCLPSGQQWLNLIQSLADRGGCSRLRITAIGPSVCKFRLIGGKLETHAKQCGIDFEFAVVESNLENVDPLDIKVSDDEVLVVNSILQLHCVVKESRGALNSFLQVIHALSPKLLVMAEQDSSHNGPFFLGRFMEALHYYSAIFDSLDAMKPKYDTKRAKIEQFYYGEEIKNIVSCEGPQRVERHERVDQWRRRISRAGFQAAPIKMMAESQNWLKDNGICEGFTVVEEKGCLVLGWKAKSIIAISCWKR